MKVLFVQFANSMFHRFEYSDGYWDRFYDVYRDFGYLRMSDAFEIPKWIAEASFFLPSDCFRKICWVKHSVSEAVNEIANGRYDFVLFSVMTCTKAFTRSIIEKSDSKQKFVIGGYDKEIYRIGDDFENVSVCDIMADAANAMGLPYAQGTDYSLFDGWTVLPRLTLSYGCMNNCKFCIVPHVMSVVSETIIRQQVESFKSLDFKLVYIDDKTFGQSVNYRILKDLKNNILKYNPKFSGFVIQTTSAMLVQKATVFKDIGVVVAEIGVETFNDWILRKYHKPSSEKLVLEAIHAAESAGIKVIANLIVGFEEETEETYGRTLDFLKVNETRLFGVNFAMYTDYSSKDCVGEVDFLPSDNIELHRKWWDTLNKFASERIVSERWLR